SPPMEPLSNEGPAVCVLFLSAFAVFRRNAPVFHRNGVLGGTRHAALATPVLQTAVFGLKPGFSGLLTAARSFIHLGSWNASWQPFCSSTSSIRRRSSRAPTLRSRAGA